MGFDDCQGSLREIEAINTTFKKGFVDSNGNPIDSGFYTNSCLPGSLYFISYNSAKNLIVESPNNSREVKLSHNYQDILDAREYSPIPSRLIEAIQQSSSFIRPRLQSQKSKKFIKVACNVLDRAISGVSLVR